MSQKQKKNDILYLSFNQNNSCISCGTQTGFKIFDVDPIRERFGHHFGGGIGIVETLEKTNVLALVGGGDHPQFLPNKVIIWDDYNKKPVFEIERRNRIRGVKFNREILTIINEDCVELFDFKNMTRLRKIKTGDNVNVVAGLSNQIKIPFIMTPSIQVGAVQVTEYKGGIERIVKCHKNVIKLITPNQETTKFATCSSQGTLIKIWDVETLLRVKELRRGSDQSNIYSINFSKDSKYLVSSSEKGTIHVYSLCDQFENTKSNLNFMSFVLPKYFSSEWSLFQIPYESTGKHMCCILSDDNQSLSKLLVVDYNGRYVYYKFDLKNMKYQIDKEGSILESNDDDNDNDNDSGGNDGNDVNNLNASDNDSVHESRDEEKNPKIV